MSALIAGVWGVYLATLALLGVYGMHRLSLVVRAARSVRPERSPSASSGESKDAFPHVTVQLPLFNERAVAERVIAAAAGLDWPRDRLEIQVLDDSTDDTRDLCAAACARWRAAGVDIVHLHRVDRSGWKAGALEAGRAVARGELLLVLDADFVPPPDFLRRTAGHFADPRVGLVQARWGHLTREQSLLTRLQAMLLDGHFAVEQAGRAAAGACFNFNGTAGLWRASAITAAGGWHHDTLTEDLDLSYRAALGGWHFIYAGDVVAPAELTADTRAFKAQQHRWAKGSVECARKLLPTVLRSRWPWWKKLEAIFHLTHNIPYLLTAILLLSGGICLGLGGGPSWAGVTHLLSAGVTLLVLSTFVLVSATSGERVRSLLRVPALVGLTAGMAVAQAKAVVEALAGYRTAFVRTPKDGGGAPRYTVSPTNTRWLERAMAAYLVVCTALAAQRGAAVEAAMLALLATGATSVALAGTEKKRARQARP
jgi:cellulose synthase/poly-beta-1,6-N-acetylglucosamine synthase-like glycosyltransferase